MGQTETKVAQVTLKDAAERNRTISIDNPKDDLSLNQIKAAFQPAIAGGWLLSSSGSAITEVVEAKYNQVIKTQINGLPVTVTPSSFNVTVTSSTAIGSAVTAGIITVTNGVLSGVDCPSTSAGEQGFAIRAVTMEEETPNRRGILVTRLGNGAGTYSGNLQVFIEGSNTPVTIPISVTQEAIS